MKPETLVIDSLLPGKDQAIINCTSLLVFQKEVLLSIKHLIALMASGTLTLLNSDRTKSTQAWSSWSSPRMMSRLLLTTKRYNAAIFTLL